jgi:coenzyme PQQ precursor peptide PqqA
LVLIGRNHQISLARLRRRGSGTEGTGQSSGGSSMQWQTPKLVEIACGCEINAYFPADL